MARRVMDKPPPWISLPQSIVSATDEGIEPVRRATLPVHDAQLGGWFRKVSSRLPGVSPSAHWR
jgi:hypothetical protein